MHWLHASHIQPDHCCHIHLLLLLLMMMMMMVMMTRHWPRSAAPSGSADDVPAAASAAAVRYDNEYGYSCRLVDVAAHVANSQ
jgi:hypothetical protein